MQQPLLFCSFVQFFAHLVANLFAPLVIDLRVDCEGRTGLCVSGFCGYCRHTNLRVGQEDAHKSVPKHMRMQPFNACPLSNPANQCAVAVRVDRKPNYSTVLSFGLSCLLSAISKILSTNI